MGCKVSSQTNITKIDNATDSATGTKHTGQIIYAKIECSGKAYRFGFDRNKPLFG